MSSRGVKVVLIDSNHRLYVYSKKSVLKKKINGRWVGIIVARDAYDMMRSTLISEDVKEKIRQRLR